MVGLGGGLPIKRRVRPFDVVEADPLVDDTPGLEAVGKVVQIDSLVFERAPQSLDEDVVQATAPAVHRDTDTGRLQAPGKGEAGELAALIGIENLRLAVAGQRLLGRLDARVRTLRYGCAGDGLDCNTIVV